MDDTGVRDYSPSMGAGILGKNRMSDKGISHPPA